MQVHTAGGTRRLIQWSCLPRRSLPWLLLPTFERHRDRIAQPVRKESCYGANVQQYQAREAVDLIWSHERVKGPFTVR